MKKIILSILSIAFVFAAIGQNLKGYYVEALTKLEAKMAFVIDLDTFYATTQLSGIDTILATKEYVKSVDSEKVTGAASSTDNAIARFDGITGKTIQNSGVTISDAGAIVTPSTIKATTGLFTNLADGYIPYHISDASGLSNSYINQINLGINIASGVSVGWPVNTGTSQTYAALRVKNSISNAILDFGNNGSGGFWLQHTNASNLALSYPLIFNPNGGNVVIGSTTNGVDKLQVNGSILATTAKFTNLTDAYIPKHTSDATGLENSNIFFSGNIARYGTANTFSNDRDIPDKAYVDAIATGNMVKLPVDAATTGNITLSGTQIIDDYAAVVGSRILVWKQTTASQNGVYIVASGAWTRATDLDTWAKLYKAYVTVQYGGQFGSSFVCTVPLSGTLETDPVTWILYLTPVNIVVSSPLTKLGNNISLGYDTNTLDVASNLLKVKDNVFQPLLNGTGFVKASGTTISYDNSTYLTTETDPIFAADSANLLHWSDTLNVTKGIASQYDLTTGLATKQNTLTTGNLTENVTGLQFDATRQVIGGSAQLSLTSGYVIPTTTEQTNWNTAYTDRNKWDGGATGLVAATGRTSLGGTTIGQSVFTSTNPSAIRFLRANADNTVSWLDAATFRTAIGAGTSSTNGTVTSVAITVPTGLTVTGSPITTSGTLALSLTSGYSIPTTANQTNWTAGYNDKVNSLAFSGTTTKTLTLTQQDGGSVSNTFTDLDVQTLTADSTSTTIGLTASGSNSRVHFNVDKSITNELQNLSKSKTGNNVTVNISSGTGTTFSVADGDSLTTNELNNSVSWNNTTNEFTVNDAGGNKTATITGFLESEVDGSTTNELQTLSKDSVNITNGKRYGLSISSGNRITITDMDTYVGSSWASTTNNSTNWNTAYTNRISSLTTTGSSGAATLISNVLNIPNYTLTGLGGVPTSRTLTINGTTQDLSANRTYNVGTVTSVATGLGLSGGTITITGSIALDTASTVVLSRQRAVNTYQPKGTYQTGTESYISNLVLSGNTLTSTGVGSAFNSTVGNIANTTYANVYNQSQTVTSTSSANGFRVQDAGSLLISSVGTDYGLFYMRDGNPYFVNGDFGSSEINLTPSPMIYPSAGIAVSTGSAWGTSITDNSANWNTSYNDKVNSLAVTGTTTKTITLTQQDGGTVTGNFTDNDTYTSLVSNGGLGASGGSLYLSNVNATGTAPLLTDYMWAAPSSSTTVKSFTLQTLKDLIGTSSYTLPLAANGTRGGIQIGYTSTANNFALQLSSEKAYTALPDATTSVKGIASFSSGNFSISSGAVSVATGGIGAMNLANAVISGQVDIGADIVDTDEFLISDAGTLRRTDASRLKTYIGAGFTDPMTTVGDIIFRDGANNTSRLPIGTGDYVLKSYMGTPSWQPIMSGTTSGAIPFNNGSGSLNHDGTAFTYNTSTNTLDADVVTVDTEVYDPTGWNGDLSIPTKDAVRDKIETMQTSYDTYYDNNSIVLNAGVNNYINIFTSPSSTANTIYAIVDIHVDYGNNTYTHSSGNFSSYFNGVSIVKQNWVESYHDFLTTDVSIIPEIVDNGTSSTFRIKLNSSVGSTYHYVVSVNFLHKL